MDKFFFIITDYLNGKTVYPPIRRSLNSLFSVSITSFLFEKIYFKYEWLDLNYRPILNFFIKGDFFIPFSLFVVVHYLLFIFSSFIFNLTTTRKSSKSLKNILNYQLKRSHVKSFKRTIQNNSVMPIEIDQEAWLKIYDYIKGTVNENALESLQKVLDEQKQIIEHNFNLIVKLIVVVTIYFASITHFGWLLYLLVLLLSIVGLICLWWLYLGLDLLPAAIKKFDTEVQKYLQSNLINQNTDA